MRNIIFKTIIKNSLCGSIVLIWSHFDKCPQIIRIIIPKPQSSANKETAQLFPDTVESSCSAIDNLCSMIKAYIVGKKIDFSLGLTRLQSCPNFQQKVLRATHTIPARSICSYGDLAALIGNPKAARAVGTALAGNPFPILIPCHRVIRSDLKLGGFGGGLKMKRALLEREGISFDKRGNINSYHLLNKFHKTD